MDYNGFTKKDWVVYSVIVAILIFISVLFGGCKSTRVTTDPGDIRQSSTYILGQLESSVETFDRGVERALERSKGIEDEIDRLDYLFREYEQAALRLRDEVNKIRAGEQETAEDKHSINNNTDNNDRSIHYNENHNNGPQS